MWISPSHEKANRLRGHPATASYERDNVNLKQKILISLVILGAVASVAGYGAYSAFTATTTNSGNSFSAGTVAIAQHPGATTMYTGTNAKPGDTVTKCIRVTYTGSIAAAVKLYVSPAVTNGTLFNLQVERGSGMTTLDNTDSCTGFVSSSVAYTGQLGSVATTYAAGLDGKAAAAAWAANDAVDYRITLTVNDDTTPNAHTTVMATGAHVFTWEARSN